MPTWNLLIDADMSLTGWQYTTINNYDLLRIEQLNLPQFGRFQIAQIEDSTGTFVSIDSYPSSADTVQLTPEVATNLARKFAIKAGYIQTENDIPTTWRVKLYGAVSDFVPPVNPSLAILKFDARVAGAIPIEEKGVPYGVAELGSDGKVPTSQLPPQGSTDLTTVNNRLTTLENINAASRLSVIEALNAGARLTTLEGYSAGTRLTALEGINTASRLTTLEDRPIPAFPTNHFHIWGYGKPPSGKTFSVTNQSGSELGRYAVLSSNVIGDIVEYEVLLKSGSYTMTTYGHQTTTRAIAGFYIDNVFIGSVDYYSSVAANRKVDTINFNIATSGLHSVKVITAGKAYEANGETLALSVIRIDPQSISVPSLFVPHRINAGSPTSYTDSQGNLWTPTLYDDYSGRNYDLVAQYGAFTVTGTNDQTLYKTEYRRDVAGSFMFKLPIYQAGNNYTLKLHFCENQYNSANQRIGSVSLNGTTLLSNFDIFTDAGGKNKELIKTFNNISLTNQCHITFTNTLINGIELL